MTDPERRKEANRFADRIEAQLRKMGNWREGPPPPQGLVTLDLILQYGLVDRLRQDGLPKSSNISTLATRELAPPNIEEDELIAILREFDEVVGYTQPIPAAAPRLDPKPAPVEIVTMDIELPGGRREQIAVAKGMEELVRKAYAEPAKLKPEQVRALGAKTCPHLEPLERAIEDAIEASAGPFEARGFSLQGPDPQAWGCPGPGWRCYSCSGGRAQAYPLQENGAV